MSENAISFTIVIPVYNGENTIAKTIESCLWQTVLPAEIIIVDDGSVDATEMIVNSFQSRLIRFIKNKNNCGPSFVRNIGIREATSSWILFLDADDIFHHHKLEIVTNCIQLNTSIRAIGHSFNISKEGAPPIEPAIPTGVPDLKRLSVFNTLLRNPVVTPSLAVSATNGIFFNEGLSYAEDHDFVLRTTEQYGLWYMDIPLCSLRRLPLTTGGLSSRKWEMRKGEMRMYINFCQRHHLQLFIPLFLIFSLLKHLRNFFNFAA